MTDYLKKTGKKTDGRSSFFKSNGGIRVNYFSKKHFFAPFLAAVMACLQRTQSASSVNVPVVVVHLGLAVDAVIIKRDELGDSQDSHNRHVA